MSVEYLPNVYVNFREQYPAVASALDGLGEALDEAGPLDERTARLVKLGLAVGKTSPGDVRSNTRKALAAGATADEIRHTVLLAITGCGFPAAIAGMSWVDEVLASGK